MVSTRSQMTAVDDGGENGTSTRGKTVVDLSQSPETLMDLVKVGRGERKKRKMTQSAKANDVEQKEEEKIFGSFQPPYVETGMKKGKMTHQVANGVTQGNVSTPVTRKTDKNSDEMKSSQHVSFAIGRREGQNQVNSK